MQNTFVPFLCPVCRKPLVRQGNTLRCPLGHSFDLAKQGYVNLLMKNGRGKRHGDDKLMVTSRREFLEKGYYAPLRDAVSTLVGQGKIVLDAGCGEGYYTSSFAEHNQVLGIDISKDALHCAAPRCRNARFAVASISDIPLPSESVDTVVTIFAPDSNREFLRVLRPGGHLITALPMENHLWELKQAVYDTPYKNPPVDPAREGFILAGSRELRYTITLRSNEDIQALFKMTPYYYKTSAEDQKKLLSLSTLTTQLEFFVTDYQKL